MCCIPAILIVLDAPSPPHVTTVTLAAVPPRAIVCRLAGTFRRALTCCRKPRLGGHRFSDAVSSSKSAAPFRGKVHRKGAKIYNRVPATRMPMSGKPQSTWPDVTGSPGYRWPTIGTRFPPWRIPLSRFSTATLSMATPSKARLSIASLAASLFRLALVSLGLFSLPAAGVQNPHGVQLVQAKSDATKKPEPPAPVVAPSSSELYLAQRGDSLPAVA